MQQACAGMCHHQAALQKQQGPHLQGRHKSPVSSQIVDQTEQQPGGEGLKQGGVWEGVYAWGL